TSGTAAARRGSTSAASPVDDSSVGPSRLLTIGRPVAHLGFSSHATGRSNDRAAARPIPDAPNGVPRVSMPEGVMGDPGQLPLFAAPSQQSRRSGQVSPDVLLSEIAQLLLSEGSADRVFEAVAAALA